MSRCLLTATNVATISGYGIALFPAIEILQGECFREGDPVRLVRPGRSERTTQIGEISLAKSSIPSSGCEPVLILREMTKEDIPVGTEVWSVDRI